MKLTIIFCLAIFLSVSAQAAVFTVNSNSDTNDANNGDGVCADVSGNCTLRAAAQEANAMTSADTINFSLSGATTISLAFGEIFITESLVIDGANNLSINANNQSRIFNIQRGGISVAIRNLTVTNGRASDYGGGIYAAAGDLTVENAVIRNCFAQMNGGGIYSGSGVFRLLNSTVENNIVATTGGSGGGVSVHGNNSEIRNSRILRNSAPRGGGVLIGSYTTKISETFISENSASVGGGGLLVTFSAARVSNSTISGNTANGSGGGIALPYGNVILTNSTVSGNRAVTGGGGGISTGTNGTVGYLTVKNSTVVNNTAIYAGGLTGGLASATVIGNSIVANNTANTAPNIFSFFTSLGGNIVNNRADGEGYVPTDLPDGTNPQIGTLANNGGATPTHALLANSPAINAGLNANAVDADGNSLTTDQRGAGFPRIVGTSVDIGAFEFSAAPNIRKGKSGQ